jgi:glycosyltransferase involved in cell wall biosynthesis
MYRIAMIVFSYYPSDVRVRREAETLVESGMKVDVICLREKGQKYKENIYGVNVYRINVQRKRLNKLRYIWEYIYFSIKVFFKLSLLFFRKRYHIIHVHNMPEFLVFCALLPRVAGAKILLDLHDPTPEVYMTKYSINKTHPFIFLLYILERYSIRFSHRIITPNIAFRNLFISRGCPAWKITIVMNSPMEHIFHSNTAASRLPFHPNKDNFVVMYHGTIVERHGLTFSLLAFKKIREEIPGLIFKVYGEGDNVEGFLKEAKRLGLEDIVEYYGFVQNEIIAKTIESIDVGIIPNLRSYFTELNMPVRIFEYLAIGKPVVVPRTKGICDYFDECSINFFEPGNVSSLAESILKIYHEPERQEKIVQRGINIYNRYRWDIQRKQFVNLVTGLASMTISLGTFFA